MYYSGDHRHQGDYYQGDYYQGDPFLGGLIGMAGGWLARKFARKKIAGTVAKVAGAIVPAAGVSMVLSGSRPKPPGFQIPLPGGGVFRPMRALPGGVPMTSPGCCPTGFHFNKSMTRTGAPPGTTCVRNRRMNVANPSALRRSLRRVAGFGKLAQRAKRDVARAARALK